MKATTKSYKEKYDKNIIIVTDKISHEGTMCSEWQLEDVIRYMNPDAPREVEDAIEELVYSYERGKYIDNYTDFLNVRIDVVSEDAVTYEYEQHGNHGDETYESIVRRIAALWGFDKSQIINVDWFEGYTITDNDVRFCTPKAVDYVIRTKNGRELSYSTNFETNDLTC